MKIAIIIPCFNEEITIKQQIKCLKRELPNAEIVVCDNNSTDRTTEKAKSENVRVIFEKKQGKGFALKKLLKEVDADIFFLVDGDMTYSLTNLSKIIDDFINSGNSLLVGKREHQDKRSYRKGHLFGNWLFTTLIRILFSSNITDVLSGYRIFTKQFVKSWVIASKGFEIEVDMTIHALSIDADTMEIPIKYFPRPFNSVSKLSSFKDGFKIITKVLILALNFKPFKILGFTSLFFLIVFVFSFAPIYYYYLIHGVVLKIPTLMFSMGCMVLSLLIFFMGLILQNISDFRKEIKILLNRK